jgi:hypothetical protein
MRNVKLSSERTGVRPFSSGIRAIKLAEWRFVSNAAPHFVGKRQEVLHG